jgi:hypothetical protein
MEDDTGKVKNIIKLVNKEKPPEETPGVTPNDLLKESLDQYESLILVGWKEDSFKVSWSEDLAPEEVYLQLDLAKDRLLKKMFEF